MLAFETNFIVIIGFSLSLRAAPFSSISVSAGSRAKPFSNLRDCNNNCLVPRIHYILIVTEKSQRILLCRQAFCRNCHNKFCLQVYLCVCVTSEMKRNIWLHTISDAKLGKSVRLIWYAQKDYGKGRRDPTKRRKCHKTHTEKNLIELMA